MNEKFNLSSLLYNIMANTLSYQYNTFDTMPDTDNKNEEPIDVPNLADQRMIEDGKRD